MAEQGTNPSHHHQGDTTMFALIATALITITVIIVAAVSVPTIIEMKRRNEAEIRAAHKARVDAHFKNVAPSNAAFAINRNAMNREIHDTRMAMATGYGFTK